MAEIIEDKNVYEEMARSIGAGIKRAAQAVASGAEAPLLTEAGRTPGAKPRIGVSPASAAPLVAPAAAAPTETPASNTAPNLNLNTTDYLKRSNLPGFDIALTAGQDPAEIAAKMVAATENKGRGVGAGIDQEFEKTYMSPEAKAAGWKTKMGNWDLTKGEFKDTAFRVTRDAEGIPLYEMTGTGKGVGAKTDYDKVAKDIDTMIADIGPLDTDEKRKVAATLQGHKATLLGHKVAAENMLDYRKATLEQKREHDTLLKNDLSLRLQNQKDINEAKLDMAHSEKYAGMEIDPMTGKPIRNELHTYLNMGMAGNVRPAFKDAVESAMKGFEEYFQKGRWVDKYGKKKAEPGADNPVTRKKAMDSYKKLTSLVAKEEK